jgi:hypothetical protein
MDVTKCRMCGATEPKRIPPDSPLYGEWEFAAPTDALEGAVLLDNTEVWCSQECRDADPRYRRFESGADMAHSYQRFGEACGVDLVGALARSRGLTREEAEAKLSDGAARALKKLRKEGRQ